MSEKDKKKKEAEEKKQKEEAKKKAKEEAKKKAEEEAKKKAEEEKKSKGLENIKNFISKATEYKSGKYSKDKKDGFNDCHKIEEELFSYIQTIYVDSINGTNAKDLVTSFNNLVTKYYEIRKSGKKKTSGSGFFKAIDGLYSEEKTYDFDVEFSKLLDAKYYNGAVGVFSGSKYINSAVPKMKKIWEKCADIIIANDRKNKIVKDKNVAVNQEVAGSEINNDQKDQPQNGAQASTTPAKSEKSKNEIPLPPPPPSPPFPSSIPTPPMTGQFKAGPKVWTENDLEGENVRRVWERKVKFELARWSANDFDGSSELAKWGKTVKEKFLKRDKKTAIENINVEVPVKVLVDFANNGEKIKEQQLKEKREKAKEKMKKLKEYQNKEITDQMIDEFIAKEASQKSDMAKQLGDMAVRRDKAKKEAKKYEPQMKTLIKNYKFEDYVKEGDSTSWLVNELTKSDQKITENSMLKWLNFKKVSKVAIENVEDTKKQNLKDDIIKAWVEQNLNNGKKSIDCDDVTKWLKQNGLFKVNKNDLLSKQIKLRYNNLNMHKDENENEDEDEDWN